VVLDAVIALAVAKLGLKGSVQRPLPGERTRNALVEAVDGDRVVVKVHDGADAEDVALETAALEYLAQGRAVHLVPRPIATASFDGGPGDGAGEGRAFLARSIAWMPGRTWSSSGPHPATSLRSLGRAVALVDAELAGFDHPRLHPERGGRRHPWNLMHAGDRLADLDAVADPHRRAEAGAVLEHFVALSLPRLEAMPSQAIHNDANDANILVSDGAAAGETVGAGEVCGLIDFGDLCRAPRVCGLAIALTYAMATWHGAGDPWRAVLPLVEGYHEEAPLTPAELALLPELVRARVAVSIVMAAKQHAADPDNDYLLVSQDAIWALLVRLGQAESTLTAYRLREACGYDPVPHARAVRAYLATTAAAGVLRVPYTVGGYLEDRDVYTSGLFLTGHRDHEGEPERRTVHLGVDLWAPAGTPVHAPLDGVVEALADNAAPLDYGPVVVLRHEVPSVTGRAADRGRDDAAAFFTLYGHLSRDSLEDLLVGQPIAAGEQFAALGALQENGGWDPHLHLQVLTDLVGQGSDVPGVAPRVETALWEGICPDPNLLLGLPGGVRGRVERRAAEIARERGQRMSPALSLGYAEPLHIVRGDGAYLFDAAGSPWLDLVNNVAHVGHCHPRVVAALTGQAGLLNTNTRYLHDAVITYARRLAATLPDPLSVVFLVNSGSEANDLALRLAYAATRARDVVVFDHAYHGNLSSLVDISPYKFDGPGGTGRPERTHVLPLPDAYRGRHGGDAAGYLADLDALLAALAASGRGPAAFVAEPIPGTAGQVVLADGFLAGAFERVRTAGGICVADEVQTGFGRVGSAWWAFELHGVVPDIVTMGKPMGNGHPIGAVVTTPQVARHFVTGMEYFNTFGGNPVSAAVGQAVLDVVVDERLRANADRLGQRLLADLRALEHKHNVIGDVRGAGLFLGVELVTDRETKAPASDAATAVVEAVMRRGVLLSSDGPHHNVLKIKPPLVLSESDADQVVHLLDEVLADL